MIDVFLSASVPLPERDRRFFDTADVLAIRESIKALVEVLLPVGRLTCGGHPAITPLLALFVKDAKHKPERVTIFQSAFFKKEFPKEVRDFVDVRVTPALNNDRELSLTIMRKEMVTSRKFAAAVFIGGMDGLFEELQLFSQFNRDAAILPIGSTGAAAAIIHRDGNYDKMLSLDLTYPSLFRRRILPLRKSKGSR
jgi:hypothetical protein